MTERPQWVIKIDQSGTSRTFDSSELPISLGSEVGDDIRLASVTGSLQIGALESMFFLQATRDTRNVRVNGEPLSGSRRLEDGDEIAFDTARLRCSVSPGRLVLSVTAQITAGDTAPPDLEDLARASVSSDDEVSITPITFRRDSAADVQRKPKITKTRIGVAGGFGVLAVLGWFAFTGKSVEFESDPPISDLDLPSTLFKFRIGDRYLLRSGTHRVTGSVDGYFPLDTEVEVGRERDQTIELKLEKLPGLVTITTRPRQGVEVSLDGVPIGEAPLADFEISPGLHELEFTIPRHFTEVVELDVQGMHRRQAVAATLEPDWAPVSVSSAPAGAEVLIDGRVVGASPVELELEQGTYDLELRLRGFNAWRDEIEVVASEPLEISSVKLVEADGRVRLVSEPPAAAVSVNGEYEGRTPLNLRLRPGASYRAHEAGIRNRFHGAVGRRRQR
jgi:hypothetical protein